LLGRLHGNRHDRHARHQRSQPLPHTPAPSSRARNAPRLTLVRAGAWKLL
jgi:hypothetical protein